MRLHSLLFIIAFLFVLFILFYVSFPSNVLPSFQIFLFSPLSLVMTPLPHLVSVFLTIYCFLILFLLIPKFTYHILSKIVKIMYLLCGLFTYVGVFSWIRWFQTVWYYFFLAFSLLLKCVCCRGHSVACGRSLTTSYV